MEKKANRRTRFTKFVIKEAFLRLKRSKSYNAITIAEICRNAEINRSTFYLHYRGVQEVLDEVVEDACGRLCSLPEHLKLLPINTNSCTYPFCRYLRENPKYQCIFFDDELTTRIVSRLVADSYSTFVEQMQEQTGLTVEQVEPLLYFQISGCLAVAKRFGSLSDENWCIVQSNLDAFLRNGFGNTFRIQSNSLAD